MFPSILKTFVLISAVLFAEAAPQDPANAFRPARCRNVEQRRDWKDLPDTQKSLYINAVKCMMDRPSTTSSAAKTRFDDFVFAHLVLGDEIHFTAQFLPWHRMMIKAFENELKQFCGYSGASPYWDWSKDVANNGSVKTNPIWDPVTGFGGNGAEVLTFNGEQNNNTNIPGWIYDSGGGCITDGPFANYTQSIGPGTSNTPHCIVRSFNDNFNALMSTEAIAAISNTDDYFTFLKSLEPDLTAGLGPHGAGHFAGGGTLQNVYSSPGDPVFYLHHAMVDKIWFDWQLLNGGANIFSLNGPLFQAADSPSAAFNFKMKMLGVAPDIPIGAVMDTRNNYLCYEYV